MRQWVVKAGSTSLDDMHMVEADVPAPGPGEVRVRMRAASLNRRDGLLLAGTFGQAATDFIPVSDGAGEVDAIGGGLDGWSVGDRVVGNYYPSWHDGSPAPDQGWGLGSPGQDGVLTEYAILKADRITAIPEAISFEQAACLPCAALTAWTALNGDRPYRRPLEAHEKVLVTGSGGVAIVAALLAKARGAKVVATTSDDARADQLRALGVSGVVNYRTEPRWGEVAAERYSPFDRVVNAAGPGVLDQALAAAAAGGEIALMGLYEFGEQAPNLIPLMAKGLSVRGTAVGSAAAFADLIAFVAQHQLTVPIGERFALADAKAAYRAAEAGKTFGKVVIGFND